MGKGTNKYNTGTGRGNKNTRLGGRMTTIRHGPVACHSGASTTSEIGREREREREGAAVLVQGECICSKVLASVKGSGVRGQGLRLAVLKEWSRHMCQAVCTRGADRWHVF